MIDIPVSDIKAKIREAKGLTDAEIETKIKEKLTQLAGLISEDGAAHIVANELGVELIKQGGEAKINDLYPGMRSVTVTGRVTQKFDIRSFDKGDRKGKVASFFLGDETGQVRVTLWNDQAEQLSTFDEGEILRIKNAYVKENRGYKELHLNTESKLEVSPKGVEIGEVKQSTARPARERKNIRELTGEEENVEILATLVQVYDPRFFEVCPDCGKRVTGTGAEASCPQHATVAPQTNYVLSAFLDDGTGNIRTTFWKQQAQRLTGKSDEEFLQYQENPSAFEAVKTDLLGKIVKIVGRCKKNETFDRIELTANLVFSDVDPEEELARIAEESGKSAERLDAPAKVKEEIKKAATPPKTTRAKIEEERAVVEDDGDGDDDDNADDSSIESGVVRDSAAEDVISLDDLEDLDEKL